MGSPGSGVCWQPPPVTQQETLLSKAHLRAQRAARQLLLGPPPWHQLGWAQEAFLDDTCECRGAALQAPEYYRSVMSDFATPRTVARQAPLSTGLSRQEPRSAVPFPLQGSSGSPGSSPPRDQTWVSHSAGRFSSM